MNMATIVVSGVYAHARMYFTISAGIVGATVTFEFTDPIWEGLTKTAVFQGAAVRDVILTGNTVIIPAETVAKAGPMLKVGIYGVDAENNLVIPTLWAAIGGIRDAADPSGDPGTDPELPIWAQLADRVEGVAKDVDELKKTGGGGPGTPGAPGADGGYYTPEVTQPDEDTIQFEFTPSKEGMPAIDPAQIELPAGPPGPQGSPGQPGRDGKDGKDGVVSVAGATVGQTVKIAAVDESGVPTAWEAVDFPSGGGSGGEEWEVIADIVCENKCSAIVISEDLNGNLLRLKKISVKLTSVVHDDIWSPHGTKTFEINDRISGEYIVNNGTTHQPSILISGLNKPNTITTETWTGYMFAKWEVEVDELGRLHGRGLTTSLWEDAENVFYGVDETYCGWVANKENYFTSKILEKDGIKKIAIRFLYNSLPAGSHIVIKGIRM